MNSDEAKRRMDQANRNAWREPLAFSKDRPGPRSDAATSTTLAERMRAGWDETRADSERTDAAERIPPEELARGCLRPAHAEGRFQVWDESDPNLGPFPGRIVGRCHCGRHA